MLPSEKNLHVSVSQALLTRVQRAAEEDRVTLDEFLTDAIERRLNCRELEEVLMFGKQHARARGLTLGDVAREIAAERRENEERGH